MKKKRENSSGVCWQVRVFHTYDTMTTNARRHPEGSLVYVLDQTDLYLRVRDGVRQVHVTNSTFYPKSAVVFFVRSRGCCVSSWAATSLFLKTWVALSSLFQKNLSFACSRLSNASSGEQHRRRGAASSGPLLAGLQHRRRPAGESGPQTPRPIFPTSDLPGSTLPSRPALPCSLRPQVSQLHGACKSARRAVLQPHHPGKAHLPVPALSSHHSTKTSRSGDPSPPAHFRPGGMPLALLLWDSAGGELMSLNSSHSSTWSPWTPLRPEPCGASVALTSCASHRLRPSEWRERSELSCPPDYRISTALSGNQTGRESPSSTWRFRFLQPSSTGV